MENNNDNNDDKVHDQDIVASTSGTADQSSCFPAGYRFVPTDDELITHYLAKKVNNEPLPVADMYAVDLYSHPPNELAETYPKLGDGEWYFFTPRVRKYPKGARPSRSVGDIGYWKATGAEKPINSKEGVQIGNKTSLVFYYGKPKSGEEKKTNWIMHEYKLENVPSKSPESGMTLDDCILCKIYERPERLNKKQNDANGPVADDEDQEIIEDHAIALHIPDSKNNNGMGQNHEQLQMMMNNNGYGESNGHSQPQNRGHVSMRMNNGYEDNSHQFQPQNNGHVPLLNCNRDHSHQFQHQHQGRQFQTNYNNQHQFQQVAAHSRRHELYGLNRNFGFVMPIHDQEQAPWGHQQRRYLQRVYRGQNGNILLEDPYNITGHFAFDQGRLRANSDNGVMKMRHQQHGDIRHDYDQGHNIGNNFLQHPDDNINSYYDIDEGLRANLDGGTNLDDVTTRMRHQQQGDLQNFFQGHNTQNNVEQDPHNYQGHNGNTDQQDSHSLGHNGNNVQQDPHNYQGHNGNNVQQDPHQGHNGNNVEQDPYNYQGYNGNNVEQDPHNYQGHNGNNVEQDPNGINSNFGVDEGLRANPDDGETKRPDDQLC